MRYLCVLFILLGCGPVQAAEPSALPRLEKIAGAARPRNVILILVDDLRFDALGCTGQPFIETPHIDRLAREGANCTAAYVTTSLCSPSRASILTGLYAHHHGVVDNTHAIPKGTKFFPQYLQQAGYQTAFFGKWHMGGESDAPQPGFDRWVSFRGQGNYLPKKAGLNVDGQHVPQKGYITDELTDYCVDWLKNRRPDQPFFAYLSHKAVHAMFEPAERHRGRYKDAPFTPPASMAKTPDADRLVPRWVRDQRNSWHGVEFAYHKQLDIAEYYRKYCETLLAVDDSVGRLLQTLEQQGVLDSTLILFMGDNGFCFGEHGLIDKRQAYEASMRIPLLARCPELIKAGTEVKSVVANIDVASTVLEAAGLKAPPDFDGKSFLAALGGDSKPIREALLYEYYWEWNFPHTPTMFALRTDRYKYIHYYGLWDIDELFDMQADPQEMHNLIFEKDRQPLVQRLRKQLFQELDRSGGLSIPYLPVRGRQNNRRNAQGKPAAGFPADWLED